MKVTRRDFIKTAGFAGVALLHGCGRAEERAFVRQGNWQPAYLALEAEGKLKDTG